MTQPSPSARAIGMAAGLPQALGAFLIWGLLPLHFHFLSGIAALELVAWRVIFSLALLLPLILWRTGAAALLALLRSRTALALLASAVAIVANWCIYVWAVDSGHVVAASLGYFLNPLVNMLFGRVFLGERLNRVQAVAMAIATLGVVLLATMVGGGIWISLTLAFSFALYGLIRKLIAVPPMLGLTTETLFLSPLALAIILLHMADPGFALKQDVPTLLVLAATGITTSAPLMLFAAAAQRLSLTMLGVVQYVAPTLQFLLGVLFFHETLVRAQLASFVLIWSALALFTGDALLSARRRQLAPAIVGQ